MTVLKNGNNRHSSLYNERTALTAYPDQGRLLKPCLHPSAFQSVCRRMCDALHASTWEWTYTMCLGLYVSECRLLSQWQPSLFLCVGFIYVCVTHCLRSCLPCFQLSWLLGGSGRASFSLPSSGGKKQLKSSKVKLQHQHTLISVLDLASKRQISSISNSRYEIGKKVCLRCCPWGTKMSMWYVVAVQLFKFTWIIARCFHVSLQEFSPILQLVVFCPEERTTKKRFLSFCCHSYLCVTLNPELIESINCRHNVTCIAPRSNSAGKQAVLVR